MKTLQIHPSWPVEDGLGQIVKVKDVLSFSWAKGVLPLLGIILINLLILFLFAGTILQIFDPAAGILDVGILSVLLLGLIGGLLAILCSLWLQELLWQPFKTFRKQFRSHFNQLSLWQQCILYFSAFFLLLYAILWGLVMVL
ncbi:MAG TPA: hypothetical protein PKA53_07045 [Sphingobacterium sp.]|nr:hypothetical protein [Sphingobacterium sp.]